MATHLVSWIIDIEDAIDAHDAAKKAWGHMHRPGTTATFLQVVDIANGTIVDIDMAEEECVVGKCGNTPADGSEFCAEHSTYKRCPECECIYDTAVERWCEVCASADAPPDTFSVSNGGNEALFSERALWLLGIEEEETEPCLAGK